MVPVRAQLVPLCADRAIELTIVNIKQEARIIELRFRIVLDLQIYEKGFLKFRRKPPRLAWPEKKKREENCQQAT
jgi:hypothetical protein